MHLQFESGFIRIDELLLLSFCDAVSLPGRFHTAHLPYTATYHLITHPQHVPQLSSSQPKPQQPTVQPNSRTKSLGGGITVSLARRSPCG